MRRQKDHSPTRVCLILITGVTSGSVAQENNETGGLLHLTQQSEKPCASSEGEDDEGGEELSIRSSHRDCGLVLVCDDCDW